MNYYRRFPGDYLRDTRRLNLLQHGAYTLLLDELYSTEQRIPTEQDALRICQAMTEEEKWAVSSVLTKFFRRTNRGFTNNRFERELKIRRDWRKRQELQRDRNRDINRDGHGKFTVSPSPSPSPEKETSKPKSAPSGATRKVSLPELFGLSTQMRSFAHSRGVTDPDAELDAFLDYHRAAGSRFTDWEAAWRNWCRKAEKFAKRGGNGARPAVAAGGSESFDERRRRKSQEVIGEIGARARAVVSEVGRRLPEP